MPIDHLVGDTYVREGELLVIIHWEMLWAGLDPPGSDDHSLMMPLLSAASQQHLRIRVEKAQILVDRSPKSVTLPPEDFEIEFGGKCDLVRNRHLRTVYVKHRVGFPGTRNPKSVAWGKVEKEGFWIRRGFGV